MSDRDDETKDSTRLAIALLKQQQDEEKIEKLEKRVSKLEKSVFAAQIGSAVIIGVGLALALALYLLVQKTKVGALVRAGASNREMSQVMGVDIARLFTLVFGLGAALCAVAGGLLGPLLAFERLLPMGVQLAVARRAP